MNRVRFGVQLVVVSALVVLVSWPEQRQLRAVTIWRANGTLVPRRRSIDEDQRVRAGQADERRAALGRGRWERASMVTNDPLSRKLYANPLEPGTEFTTPDLVASLGGKINALIGRARTALNTPIPYARLILRNITTGVVEAQATANEEGRFTFLDVNPSGYIVELIGPDGSIIAASELVSIAAGDVRETMVLVSAARAIGATFGESLASTVNEPVSAAASTGVTKVTQPASCASPPCQ